MSLITAGPGVWGALWQIMFFCVLVLGIVAVFYMLRVMSVWVVAVYCCSFVCSRYFHLSYSSQKSDDTGHKLTFLGDYGLCQL